MLRVLFFLQFFYTSLLHFNLSNYSKGITKRDLLYLPLSCFFLLFQITTNTDMFVFCRFSPHSYAGINGENRGQGSERDVRKTSSGWNNRMGRSKDGCFCLYLPFKSVGATNAMHRLAFGIRVQTRSNTEQGRRQIALHQLIPISAVRSAVPTDSHLLFSPLVSTGIVNF